MYSETSESWSLVICVLQYRWSALQELKSVKGWGGWQGVPDPRCSGWWSWETELSSFADLIQREAAAGWSSPLMTLQHRQSLMRCSGLGSLEINFRSEYFKKSVSHRSDSPTNSLVLILIHFHPDSSQGLLSLLLTCWSILNLCSQTDLSKIYTWPHYSYLKPLNDLCVCICLFLV